MIKIHYICVWNHQKIRNEVLKQCRIWVSSSTRIFYDFCLASFTKVKGNRVEVDYHLTPIQRRFNYFPTSVIECPAQGRDIVHHGGNDMAAGREGMVTNGRSRYVHTKKAKHEQELVLGYKVSRPAACSDSFPPTKCLNLPKCHHHPGIKCSNTRTYQKHFVFKPKQKGMHFFL